MTRRILQWVGSVRGTIGVIVALGLLFLAGLWIPQKTVLPREMYRAWAAESPRLVRSLEWAGLTEIHRSPVAIVLWGAFFANLLAALVVRAPGIARRARMDDAIPSPSDVSWQQRRRVDSPGVGSLERAGAFLSAVGFRVRVEGDRLRAVKHRLSPLATLLFHASFLLLAVGGMVSTATRFEGTIELAEGETFDGAPGWYDGMPRVGRWGRWPALRFTVEEVVPEMEAGTAVGLTVRLRTEDGAPAKVEINHPYRAPDGSSFVFNNLGVAPILALTDREGRERWTGGIRLRKMDGSEEHVAAGPLAVELRLYPDAETSGGMIRTRSREMKDPVLEVVPAASAGAPAASTGSLLRPGAEIPWEGGRLRFVDWRYWVRLYVRSEQGIPVIWSGFILAAIALSWRLLAYRRELILAIPPSGSGLLLAGRADFYGALFEDYLDELVPALERELRGAAPSAATVRR
jgi:hypothetical protein